MNKIQLILLGIFLLGTFSVYAQEEFMPPLEPDRVEQMEALRIWKMTEFLDLDTEQSTQFFPRLKEHENIIHEIQKKQRDMMTEIYKEIDKEDSQISQADIKTYAHKMAEAEKEIVKEKERFINSLGDILTEKQQAKFIVFENRFRNRLMRSLNMPHDDERSHKRKDRQ